MINDKWKVILNERNISIHKLAKEARQKAKALYPLKSFDGCYWCCRNCHKG